MKQGATSTATIAEEWRREVLSTATWAPSLNQAGGPVGAPLRGEAQGMYAQSDALPKRRVYMKPGIREGSLPDPRTGKPDPRRGRAAREKIASDLAHDLGVKLPPVILANRNHATAEKNVCISLVMHTSAWSWAELVPKLDGTRPAPKVPAVQQLLDRARGLLAKAASEAMVFDSWVAQFDHGPHNNHNVVFGYEPSSPENCEIVLLDYALSFGIGGAWADKAGKFHYSTVHCAPLHPLMMKSLDKAEMISMINRIEGLSDTAIDSVVGRIPDSHLAPSDRDLIAEALKARRGLLRSALAAHL